MKKGTLLNSEISHTISKMGHTDTITIGDAGLPISDEIKRIDIALKKGIPTLLETLEVVLDELKVEEVIIAKELEEVSEEFYKKLMILLNNKCSNFSIKQISHEEFKENSKLSKAIIRTGECTPYANISLKSGVTF